jgi:excisionase family DNA binding protein
LIESRAALAADSAALTKSFYSPAEVAELASISKSTVLKYIHAGELAAVRLSARTYRIPRKAVLLLLGLPSPPVVIIRDDDGILEEQPRTFRSLGAGRGGGVGYLPRGSDELYRKTMGKG